MPISSESCVCGHVLSDNKSLEGKRYSGRLYFIKHTVSTGLENPGKSLNWKRIPGLESPEINFPNLSCVNISDFD